MGCPREAAPCPNPFVLFLLLSCPLLAKNIYGMLKTTLKLDCHPINASWLFFIKNTWSISSFRAKIVLLGEQCTHHQPARLVARRHPRAPARAHACPRRRSSLRALLRPCSRTPPTSLRVHACTSKSRTFMMTRPPACARSCARLPTPAPTREPDRAPEPPVMLCMPMHVQPRAQLARTWMLLHPNILPRIPPSRPTLKPFPDSFLVSQG
ncbi:hypothetical protein CRG98_003636 [Punica granatum]|uniref:Uncharacterized protein n=1 Tax=Punica granatum TaxID=22663 RepID=A0A2I0L5L1_PUNGR|nr:hypothetical protein CRG98_003636 [Punica granatum]